MSGALTQLAAIGQQDIYLSGSPDFTFWKCGYQQHTNYTVEPIALTFQSSAAAGKKVTASISRNGDLVFEVYLKLTLAANTATATSHYTNAIGHALIDHVDIEIGGHRHDRHYGDFLEIWSELSDPPANEKREKIGKFDSLAQQIVAAQSEQVLYVPLQFWFNRHRCHALPMIALQYHEVKIHVQFNKLDTSPGATDASLSDASLLVDYVFLDTAERRMFAQQPHEYLLDQLQYVGAHSIAQGTDSSTIQLNFNHPVKELIFVIQRGDKKGTFDYSLDGAGEFVGQGSEPLREAKLQLNGHSRFENLDAKYFRVLQPYKHHSRIPNRYIYVFSFAAHPETYEPTGSCNFSRIDTVTLQLDLQKTLTGSECRVYARSVNVLRILSGMAGLRYAN
jgi:hypothetical protein